LPVGARRSVADIDAVRRAGDAAQTTTARTCYHAALRQVRRTAREQAGLARWRRIACARLRALQRATREQVLQTSSTIVNSTVLKKTCPVEPSSSRRRTRSPLADGALRREVGDKVRVVSGAGFSMELCGGTTYATGDIGLVRHRVGSGVAPARGYRRRLPAWIAQSVREERESSHALAQALNARPEELLAKDSALLAGERSGLPRAPAAKMKAAMRSSALRPQEASPASPLVAAK